MSESLWKDIVDFLLTNMGSNMFDRSSNLIGQIAPVFAAFFGIYIIFVTWDYYNRGLDETVQDFTKRILGWLIIIACAFNAAQYNQIAHWLYEFPEMLAGALGNGEYNASAIDTAWNSIFDFGQRLLSGDYEASKQSGNLLEQIANAVGDAVNIDFVDKVVINIVVIFMYIVAAITFAVIIAFYLVAKLSLAMVIMIGPLFLGCLLFPATRQWGMNWIGQVFNYAVTITYYVVVSILMNQYFTEKISMMLTQPVVGGAVAIAIPVTFAIFAAGAVFILVTLGVPAIASALLGGASAGGFSNLAHTMRNLSGIGKVLGKFGGKRNGITKGS